MELFTATVETIFEGKKSTHAKSKPGKMADRLYSKIAFYSEKNINPLM
jgi:hypothetical protein